MVTFIASGAIVGMNNTPFSYEDMFDSYAFADGTPFGIKERNSYGSIKRHKSVNKRLRSDIY